MAKGTKPETFGTRAETGAVAERVQQAAPLTTAEGDALMADIVARFAARGGGTKSFGIAVSGGADSLALMHLVHGWAKRLGDKAPVLHVITVDHALRKESADEARRVAAMARFLGLAHTTLTWSGPKPTTGKQEAARLARYRLLGDFAKARRINAVFFAHTADDQAETVLMRLARGSGVDGLSGMEPISAFDGLIRLRPLLDVGKARLIATLEATGTTWIEDPSNSDMAFERVRWRALQPSLSDHGLTPDALLLSARRNRRARLALDSVTDRILSDASVYDGRPYGYCRFAWSDWVVMPEEFRVRTLQNLLAAIGGQSEPVSLQQIEALERDFVGPEKIRGRTLARCRIAVRDGQIIMTREEGRDSLPERVLEPGTRAIWDNRFAVSWAERAKAPIMVRALGADGLKHVTQNGQRPPGHPAEALRTLPAFWRGDALVAAPILALMFEQTDGRFAGAPMTALRGDADASCLAALARQPVTER